MANLCEMENSMQPESDQKNLRGTGTHQFSTFFLGERLYGIDVMQVQEVTKPMPVTQIRLAPAYVEGLINLRGQIATAIGLRELFGLNAGEKTEKMTVVCKSDGNLYSLLVDRIGDVIEVSSANFEEPPDTLSPCIRQFMVGVYKTEGPIMSVIGVDKIFKKLNENDLQQINSSKTEKKVN